MWQNLRRNFALFNTEKIAHEAQMVIFQSGINRSECVQKGIWFRPLPTGKSQGAKPYPK